MKNLKTISVATLAISICAMAGHAAAQTAPQTADKANQAVQMLKSAQADSKAMPKGMTVRKIKRVVTPVPTLASATTPKESTIYSGVINATTSEPNVQTRFIYNRHRDDIHMPVYFSKDSLKSK